MVSENRVLSRIFGPKRDEVTGEWRKLHNGELNELYTLHNIIRVVKSRRMRWAGHVARMGIGLEYKGFWWGNLKEREHLEDSGLNGRIILSWFFKQWDGGMDWMELAQDRVRWRALVTAVMNLQIP